VPGVPNAGFATPNGACQFTGIAPITVPGPSLNLTGPFAVSAWIKTTPGNGNQTVVGHGSASYRLLLDAVGCPRFAVGQQPNGDIISPQPIDDGQWHHLAGVYDALNSEWLYVDGQLAASTARATTSVVGNYEDLWIGGDPEGGTFHPFKGVIDEVALFTNSLSAAQVLQLFSAASPPRFQDPSRVPGAILLTWSALPARAYQIQFKTNLAQTGWINLGDPITATNSSVSAPCPAGPEPQRFYQAFLMP
jgi:hypothetical protein